MSKLWSLQLKFADASSGQTATQGPRPSQLEGLMNLQAARLAAARVNDSADGLNSNFARSRQAPPKTVEHRDIDRDEIAVRVSVIDGAGRMVYSDLRDHRGWSRPLAAEQALKDARRKHDVHGEASWPKLIRVTEWRAGTEKIRTCAAVMTPDQAGMSIARDAAQAAIRPAAALSGSVATNRSRAASGRSR